MERNQSKRRGSGCSEEGASGRELPVKCLRDEDQ